jgi:hypothetical protein
MVIDDKILDEMARLEVQALLDGLNDPEMRKNPAFLEKVRKFMSQNKLQTTPETEGFNRLKKATEEIPDFPCEVNIN